MPSVNGPDGGYNFYQKTLNDLEDELKNEQKRAKTREEDKTNSLEEAYKRNLEERDRQLEETVAKVREKANETIANDRKYSKAEVDRIKNDTYDKYGRFNGLEADEVNHQFSDFKRASAEQHAKDQRNLADNDQMWQGRLDEERAEHQDSMEKYARASRDAANDSYSKAYQGQVAEYDQFKQEAEKKFENLTREHQLQMNEERHRTERYLSDAQRDYDRKIQRTTDTNDSRFDKLNTSYDDRMRRTTQQVNEGRDAETRQLRAQLSELLDSEPRYQHEKGEGRQEAINAYDDEWRGRERVLDEDYQRQIENLKHAAKESDRYYTHLNNENLREKDAYFTKVISNVNAENHLAQKDLQDTFSRDRSQLDLQMRRDRERAQTTLESQLHESELRHDQVLQGQAKAFQDTLEHQRVNDESTIKRLEKELTYKSTSDDTSVISPAADAAMRKTYVGEYEKVLGAERNRHENAINSMQREYQERVADTLAQKESDETSMKKQHTVDRELERNRLLAAIQDTQFNKDEALRSKDFEHDKQTENLNRNYAKMLEKQRREYDEVLMSVKNENSYKLTAARQEADFSLKMAQKSFTQRQNELIRDYDKKLAEQKAQYETQIDDLKTQTQLAVRDVERKVHQDMDEQARAYEQRLAQAEYQHKERERYMTENFQDQLEKVKRSNALLVSKKS